MSRSLGRHLPDSVRTLFDGSDLAAREGLTCLLVTTDELGWPHVAMLSVGELLATDASSLRAALWLHSSTSRNLVRDSRALLALVVDGRAYYARLSATRGDDLDLGADGRLASFALDVEDVLEDAADYATLTSGVTFRLHEPAAVVPRWQRTIDALRARHAS
jgi:hypothetical protein